MFFNAIPRDSRRSWLPNQSVTLIPNSRGHYSKRPTEYGDEYIRWEFERDKLISEKAATEAFNRARQQSAQELSKQHNDSVVNTAYDKYKGKVNDDEFKAMADFVLANVRPGQNNTYPPNSFDIAYSVLHGSRAVEEAKISAVKSVAKSMEKAKPASGNEGKLKQPDKEPRDEEDDAFEEAIHERYKPISR